MLIDSHCHLDRLDPETCDGSLPAVLDAARARGIGHFLCVGINLQSFAGVRAIAEAHDDVSCSVGVHPLYDEISETCADRLVEAAVHEKVVAIGETGLDYYYVKDHGTHQQQQESFRLHIQAARRADLPVIIHTRDARPDTLQIMQEEGASECGGVLHCFTESWEMAKQAMDLGFYISLSGIVTFRNADALREVARKMPADRLLVETDSPYLAPVPHRGKSNQPAYVRDVAEFVAKLRGETLEDLAAYTTDNFWRLFPRAVS